MPRHDVDPASIQLQPDELVDPDDNVIHVNGVVRLKKKGADGSWSPTGVYGSGSLLVDVWRPTLVTELTGFWSREQDTDNGIVGYRISLDEGHTELFWDGVTWAEALPGQWNTELELDAGVGSLPKSPSYALIVYLESADGTATPSWHGSYLFYEVDYDPSEDLLRSLYYKIVNEAHVAALDHVFHQFEEATLQLDLDTTVWKVNEPIRVYDSENDPQHLDNLFQSFDGTQITLVAPTSGNLAVYYRGTFRPDQVHISTDGDYQLQRLPAVVIYDRTQDRVRDDLEPGFEEQLRSKEVVRIRPNPARHTYNVNIRAISQAVPRDRKSSDAVRRAFDTKEWVRSVALDEEFPLVGVELVTQTNQTREQLFERTVQVQVSILEWLPAARDVPMAFKITQRERVGGKIVGQTDTE